MLRLMVNEMDTCFKEICPHCKVINIYNIGDPTDLTVDDPDGVKCYACGKLWIFEGVDKKDDFNIIDGQVKDIRWQ